MSQRDAADAERSRARALVKGERSTASTDPPELGDPRAGTLATVAVVGTIIFVVLIASLHFVKPETSPIDRPTSEYAVGRFGYLMTTAFIAQSAATWALVVGLRRGLSRPAQSLLGLGLLAVFGIGLLLAATFHIDLDGAPQTRAGTIHAINGSIAFLSLTLGTNLVARRLKLDGRWRPIHRTASVLALLIVPEFIASGVTAARGTGAGIAQRILLLTFSTWFLVVALRLRANATDKSATQG